jgi:hypothetical protein
VGCFEITICDLKPGRGGRRYAPYAFTEQGVAMLSSVVNSGRAIALNIEITRSFVRIRSSNRNRNRNRRRRPDGHRIAIDRT